MTEPLEGHPRGAAARLLFLESLPTISGGQAMLIQLARHLAGRYELHALLPGEGALAQALRAAGVVCHFAPMGAYTLVRKSARDVARYAARAPGLTLRTWRLVRGERIDLVYANSGRTFVWGSLAAALAGRGVIWHHHNLLADRKSLRLLRWLGRLRTVRRIICASPAAAQQFPALGAKLAVVSPGVDVNRFRPDPAARARGRQALGLAADALVAGMVGDLIPLKGHAVFIEAARATAQAVPGAAFVIVGAPRPGPEGQAYVAGLRQRAAEAGLDGRLVWAGHADDMLGIYNALDVLVVASRTETVPLVLLEALACGLPAVSTPVGRAPELLAAGTAGRLFAVDDAGELAGILSELLARPAARRSLGAAARMLAEARLPQEHALAALEAIIRAELPRAAAGRP